MLLSFFRRSHISVIVFVILALIAIWIKTFVGGDIYPYIFDSIKMPLYAIVTKYLTVGLFWSKIITVVLILSIALYLLHLNGKYIIIKQRTYLPVLFFILTSAAFIPIQRINPAIFASFFIVLALDHIFATYQKSDPLDNLFRAGISLSIASMFYAPALSVYLLLFIGLSILRSFSFREWFVSLLGIALPWGVLLLVNFWFDIDFSAITNLLKSNLITETESSIDDLIPIVFTAVIGIPTLVALVYMIPSMASQKISVRKYQNIFFWMLLICGVTFAFIPTCSYEIAYIGAIPLSYQLTNYFSSVRGGFWPNLLFILILMAALAIQLYSALSINL